MRENPHALLYVNGTESESHKLFFHHRTASPHKSPPKFDFLLSFVSVDRRRSPPGGSFDTDCDCVWSESPTASSASSMCCARSAQCGRTATAAVEAKARTSAGGGKRERGFRSVGLCSVLGMENYVLLIEGKRGRGERPMHTHTHTYAPTTKTTLSYTHARTPSIPWSNWHYAALTTATIEGRESFLDVCT